MINEKYGLKSMVTDAYKEAKQSKQNIAGATISNPRQKFYGEKCPKTRKDPVYTGSKLYIITTGATGLMRGLDAGVLS